MNTKESKKSYWEEHSEEIMDKSKKFFDAIDRLHQSVCGNGEVNDDAQMMYTKKDVTESEVSENPCNNCKYKNIDWKHIEDFKNYETNPSCIGCYKKECYTQSLRPTHNVSVNVADNEVLVKYTLKDRDLQKFISIITKLTNYVTAIPSEDVNKEYVTAEMEDNILTALNEVESTVSIIDAPCTAEKYLNDEYDETYLQYMSEEIEKNVRDFFFSNKNNKS